jgi:hypothetical protein
MSKLLESSTLRHIDTSAYSMFVLAIRSPVTKEKYLQRIGYFFDFIGIKRFPIEERCNLFGEVAKKEVESLSNNILRYLQFQKERVARKEITGSILRISCSANNSI